MRKQRTELRFSFCSDCGAKAFALCDGVPLCRTCVSAVLSLKSGGRRLTDLSGADLFLETCPGCGSSAAQAQETGLMGCPSCYDSFRTITRQRMRAS